MDRYELVTTAQGLFALRDEWSRLCARTPGHFLGQTPDWAWQCWRTIAAPRSRAIACVVARSDTRLVLVWPLAVAHDRWRGRVARPLDSESSEYSDVLVEPGPEAAQRVAGALRALRDAGVCDRLELPNVWDEGVLGRVLARWDPPGDVVRTGTLEGAWVTWRGIETWEQYFAGLHSHERRELGRKKRRLAELGSVRFDAHFDPAECARLIDWTLAQKLPWLEKTGRRNEWIGASEHRDFLVATQQVFGPSGRRVVFALRLDEEVIATLLSSVDGVRLEWFMCASDDRLARLSPAQVLREYVLRWAFERRLDCDFRLGEQRFKALWGNRVSHTSTWVLATSARGRAFVVAARAKRDLAARVPAPARAAIKAWVRKVSAPASLRRAA